MLSNDSADLRVLYLGGTGAISASCVRLSVESGMHVSVLNRGRNSAERSLPPGVTVLSGDVTDDASLGAAVGDHSFDAVVNFLSYDAPDAERMVSFFGKRTAHYVHISSASVYGKPVLQTPVTESTPVHNRFLAYARAKLRAEQALNAAYQRDGFPVTVVRPSHTYDDANPPVPGGWTVLERLARGAPIPVHGDGTSLWTLTHAEDFAVGLVGLLGNPRAVGETFHITSDDVYTWDQIYGILASALGVEANLVHVASELFPVVAPDWFWSELLVGDLAHSAVFDNTKIRRFVPGFAPKLTFHRAAHRLVRWRQGHPASTAADASTNAVLDRIVAAFHQGRAAFEALAPGAVRPPAP
jgi:nucleoside-diphosphate-sugar epimerase